MSDRPKCYSGKYYEVQLDSVTSAGGEVLYYAFVIVGPNGEDGTYFSLEAANENAKQMDQEAAQLGMFDT